jgi:hypothetical protein
MFIAASILSSSLDNRMKNLCMCPEKNGTNERENTQRDEEFTHVSQKKAE